MTTCGNENRSVQAHPGIEQRLHGAGARATLELRHLYHDREEVTGCILPLPHAALSARTDRTRAARRARPV